MVACTAKIACLAYFTGCSPLTAVFMHRILLFLLITLATALGSRAQTTSIPTYIQQIAKGWPDDAKKALPDLLIDRPDDPGVMFLHATLVDDAQRALPMLERIVQQYPTSEWADDALARIILHACLTKNVAKAKAEYEKLRDQYATSPLLLLCYDAVRTTVGAPASAVPATRPKPYTIGAGTFSSKEQAQKLVDVFTAKRMRAVVAAKTVKGKQMWVVQVGEYASEAEAAREVGLVSGVCKCTPIVLQR